MKKGQIVLNNINDMTNKDLHVRKLLKANNQNIYIRQQIHEQ